MNSTDRRPVTGSPDPSAQCPTWRSQELLKGAREVQISHEAETYRLRLTRNGKLILTK